MDEKKSLTRVNVIGGVCPKQDGSPLIGGSEKAPFRVAKYLSLIDDLDVKFYFFDGGPGFKDNHVSIRTIPAKLYLSTIFKEFSVLTNWKKISDADVLQIHHPHFALAAGLMRFLTRRPIKIIVKAHGTAYPEFKSLRATGIRGLILFINNWLHLRHDIAALKFADICICSSEFQKTEMERIYRVNKDKLVAIYNGYDPEYYICDKITKVPKTMLIVGRPVRKKNMQYAIKLFEYIYSIDGEYTLTIIAGSKKKKEDPISSLYIDSLIGKHKGISVFYDVDETELAKIYARSDVFICPSIEYESIPSVLYEAMACGCKIFTSYLWGIPEVLPSSTALTHNVQKDAALILNSELKIINYSCEKFSYSSLAKVYKDLYV